MTHDLHRLWLRTAAVVFGAFGPVCFFGTMEPTLESARWSLDLLSWPPDGATTWEHPDTRLLSALAGGFRVGWEVLVRGLAALVCDAAPEAVRRCVLSGVLAWFVLSARAPSRRAIRPTRSSTSSSC